MPTILLDYGHGGEDGGAISGNLFEKTINFTVGKRVKYHLERHGYKVIESRGIDTYVSLTDRSDKANVNKVDLVISIHCNSYKDSSAQGVEIYYYEESTRGKLLAEKVLNNIVLAKLYTKNRGLKTNNLHMTRETKAPSILIEMGFLSNGEDRLLLLTKQEEFAIAITKGVMHYYDGHYIPEVIEISKSDTMYRVQLGAFREKRNAEILVKDLKEKGYNAIIV